MQPFILYIGFSFVVFISLGFNPNRDDLIEKVDSLNALSEKSALQNRAAAIALANDAANLSQEVYEKGRMQAYLNLGSLYSELDQVDSALYYLKLVEPYFKEDSHRSAKTYFCLGKCYSYLRDFSRAEKYMLRADVLFESLDSYAYRAEVQNSLGVIKGRQDDLNSALEFFLKAYKIKLENGLRYDKELTNVAIAYRLLKQYDKALEFAKESLIMCIDVGDKLGVAKVHVSIGNIYMSYENYDSAIYHYEKAFDMAWSNGYGKQALSALTNKSVALESIGYIDQAAALLKRVVSLSLESDPARENAYFELAAIYKKREQIDSAIQYAKKSYLSSVSSKNSSLSKETSHFLSKIYERANRPDSALRYLNLFIAFDDTLSTRNNESRLSDMRVRIETLEQENEINILNQERELDELKRIWLIAAIIWLILIGFLLMIVLIYRHRDNVRKNELEQLKLKEKIDQAQADLYQQTLQMIHTNNCLGDIEEQLVTSIKKDATKESKDILRTIRLNKSLDKDWENFNQYFGSVHSEFYDKLLQASSDLSNHEQRVCALIKLNLSNREIATILNIESKSVGMLKYRIKKKFSDVGKDEELSDYLKRL